MFARDQLHLREEQSSYQSVSNHWRGDHAEKLAMTLPNSKRAQIKVTIEHGFARMTQS